MLKFTVILPRLGLSLAGHLHTTLNRACQLLGNGRRNIKMVILIINIKTSSLPYYIRVTDRQVSILFLFLFTLFNKNCSINSDNILLLIWADIFFQPWNFPFGHRLHILYSTIWVEKQEEDNTTTIPEASALDHQHLPYRFVYQTDKKML